jgi:hypothetical protein
MNDISSLPNNNNPDLTMVSAWNQIKELKFTPGYKVDEPIFW